MTESMLNTSFNFQLKKLEQIVTNSSKELNQAEFLFSSNARTTFFMLEALFRVCEKISTKNNAEFWHKEFKSLEDALGKIDFYKELNSKKNITKKTVSYFTENQNKAYNELNIALSKKTWFNKTGLSKLNKEVVAICKSISEQQIAKEILSEMQKINSFVESEIEYTDVELSTHEIRRKLRWISIYCQSFRGLFQLRHHAKSRIKLEKYLTIETITSPFNKLPVATKTQESVFLKDNYFFALSWIINELGVLKDKGLLVLTLTEAIQKTEKTSHSVSFAKACSLLGENKNCITNILEQTEIMVNEFFEKKVIAKLEKDINKKLKQK